MKYVAYWLGAAAILTLGAIILYAGWQLIMAIGQDAGSQWIAYVVLGIVALATVVAVVEYLTDQREPPEPPIA